MKSIEVLKDMLIRTDVVVEKAALGEGIMALKREQVPDRDWGEYCPNCGRRVTVCDKYCRECGQRLPVWRGWSE